MRTRSLEQMGCGNNHLSKTGPCIYKYRCLLLQPLGSIACQILRSHFWASNPKNQVTSIGLGGPSCPLGNQVVLEQMIRVYVGVGHVIVSVFFLMLVVLDERDTCT